MSSFVPLFSTRIVVRAMAIAFGFALVDQTCVAENLNPPAEHWRSSADFGFEMEIEERETRTRGTIRPRQGTDEFASAALRIGWQGIGPAIARFWGQPRPIARAGLKWNRVNSDSKAGGYDAGKPDSDLAFILALSPAARPNRFATLAPEQYEGFEIAYRDGPIPGAFAGVGLSFERAIPGDRFLGWVALKPTVDWSLRRYALRGGFTQVDLTATTPGAGSNPPIPAEYVVTRQLDTMSFWEHRLGPSIEFETGLRDREGFAVSLFFAARFQLLVSRAVHTWGDPIGITKTAYDRRPTQAAPVALDPSGEVVRFRSEAQPLVMSLGGGLRLHWF